MTGFIWGLHYGMTDLKSHWGKAYTDDDITVYYDAGRCIHFAACVRGLPQVFNPKAKPWIRADAAPAEQIAGVVRRCPTGALHYKKGSGWKAHGFIRGMQNPGPRRGRC